MALSPQKMERPSQQQPYYQPQEQQQQQLQEAAAEAAAEAGAAAAAEAVTEAAEAVTEMTTFEARLPQCKVLKQLIEAIKDLAGEAYFDCSVEANHHLSIQSMDSEHVTLVRAKLYSHIFDTIRSNERYNYLGFKTAVVHRILNLAGDDDVITIREEKKGEGDHSTLKLMFESPNQDWTTEYELKLIDIRSMKLMVPNIKFKCTVRMSSVKFQRIIRHLKSLGEENCDITCTKDVIRFVVSGEYGTGSVLLRSTSSSVSTSPSSSSTTSPPPSSSSSTDGQPEKKDTVIDNDNLINVNDQVIIDVKEDGQQPIHLALSLRYLSLFTRATNLGPTVILSMSPGIPMVVKYPIDDVGYIMYYLAPKVEELPLSF